MTSVGPAEAGASTEGEEAREGFLFKEEAESAGAGELPAGEAGGPSAERAPAEEHVLGLPEDRGRRLKVRAKREDVAGGVRRIQPSMCMIIGAALTTLVLTIAYTRLSSIDYSDFAFFLLLFTFCAFFDLEIRGGGEINLGLAPLLAALVSLPAVEVVWVFFFGSIITLIVLKLGEMNREDVLGLLLNFTGVGIMAVAFRFFERILPKKPLLLGDYSPGLLIAAAIGVALFFLVQLIRATYLMSEEGHIPAGGYFNSVLRKSWLPFISTGFVGILMGLIYRGIGLWSVLIAVPMLFVVRYAFNRVAATDQYLLETIRTLAAIPEETGMVRPGHAERVAMISVAVAREIGLAPEDVKQIEYAAYLHDIGAIIKAGRADSDQQQLLEVEGVIAGGVDIVGKVPYLEVAAEILRGREGLRDRIEDVEKRKAVSIGAGILRAVDDFEGLVQGSEGREPLSESEALTEMNLERGVRYDSKVLRAIGRVTARISREGQPAFAEGSAESPPFWGGREA